MSRLTSAIAFCVDYNSLSSLSNFERMDLKSKSLDLSTRFLLNMLTVIIIPLSLLLESCCAGGSTGVVW